MEATVAAANAKPLVKVAALCGSVRRGSYNRDLIRSAIEMSKGPINGLEIEDVDITGLPMLNIDLEGEGSFPPVVEAFRQKIREADSVLFASPEYNYSVSAKSLIKIVAISGSLRQGSYNRGLIHSAIEISKGINAIQIEYIDISPLSMLNTDLKSDRGDFSICRRSVSPEDSRS